MFKGIGLCKIRLRIAGTERPSFSDLVAKEELSKEIKKHCQGDRRKTRRT